MDSSLSESSSESCDLFLVFMFLLGKISL
jgi:hypothetical protein